MPPQLAIKAVSPTWAQVTKVLGASETAYVQAWKLSTSHHYQMWDALIAVCAEHGIKKLYSEDAGSMKKPLGV